MGRARRLMAERVGFEPTVPLPAHVLSRHADSSTLAPLPGKNAEAASYHAGSLSSKPKRWLQGSLGAAECTWRHSQSPADPRADVGVLFTLIQAQLLYGKALTPFSVTSLVGERFLSSQEAQCQSHHYS